MNKKNVFFVCVLLGCFAGSAQNKGLSVDLEEVEVSASSGKLYSEQGRVLTVVDKLEIERLPVHTIDELLDYVSGLDLRQRGTGGVQADVSIRGGSFDQVLVLLNGINITNPQSGHYNLDIPVDLADVSRVEVLQGASARVLGVNAFSGAINIVTEQPGKTELSARLTAGGFNTTGQHVSASYGTEAFRMLGSASHERSDGYIDNTDYETTDAFLHAVYQTGRAGKFGLQAGYQQKAYGANGFYSLSYPNQFDRTRTFLTALSWSLNRARWQWNGQLYWRQHHDVYELFRDFEHAPDWYTGHNYHRTDVGGGKLTVSYRSVVGKFTLGADVRDEHIFSNVLGDPMNAPKRVPFVEEASYTHAKNRLSSVLFADYSQQFGAFFVSVGGAVNHTTDFGLHYFGGADLGYRPSDGLKLYASFNSAVRLPTFTDLYYKSATQLSNPDLKPETSKTFEVGAEYRRQSWSVEADVYYRLGDHIIDWVKHPDSIRWESRNLTDVNALGGDVSFRYDFEKSFVRSVTMTYSYLHLDKKAEGFDSKYALDYLKHKCRVAVRHAVWNRLEALWNLSFNDRFGTYGDFGTGALVDYAPYFLLDARLQWSGRQVDVFADVNNILNTHYADYGGLPQPGINWRVGLVVRVGKE